MAGNIGVIPWSLTLRELTAMWKAYQNDRWNHTTRLQATVMNLLASEGDHIEADEIHPMKQEEVAVKRAAQKEAAKLPITVLKALLPMGGRNQK